jgi:hypothetical protein
MKLSCETYNFEDLQSKFNNCIEIFKNNNEIFLQFREGLDVYLDKIISKSVKRKPLALIKLSKASNFLGLDEKTIIKFAKEGKIYTEKDSNTLYDPFSYLKSVEGTKNRPKYKEIVLYCRDMFSKNEHDIEFFGKQKRFADKIKELGNFREFKNFSFLASSGHISEDEKFSSFLDKVLSRKISTVIFMDKILVDGVKDETSVAINFLRRFGVKVINLEIRSEMWNIYKNNKSIEFTGFEIKSYANEKKVVLKILRQRVDTDNNCYVNSKKACEILGITEQELNFKKESGDIEWYKDCRILNYRVDNVPTKFQENNQKRCIAYYEKLRENDTVDYESIFDNIIKNEYIIYTDTRNVTKKFNLDKILKQISLNLVYKVYIFNKLPMSRDLKGFIHLVAVKFNCEVKFLSI